MLETREQVLEKVMAQPKPSCPHCGTEMNLWEVPPLNVGDGLGWGAPFLFLCFNDECPLYKQGWDHLKENYAHNASYRCMNYPGTEQYEVIPVFSNQGGRGQIIDEEVLAEQEAIKEAIKNGFAMLAECFVISVKWGPLNRCAMPDSAINWSKKKSTRPFQRSTKDILPVSAHFVPRSLKNGPRSANTVKKRWPGSNCVQ